MSDERRAPAEQLLRDGVEEQLGRPLSRHALRYERTLEAHLRANAPPRWMERLGEIERGTRMAERELAGAYRALRRETGNDDAAFAQRWLELATAWDLDEVNEHIRTHNEWYPVERDLPLDPRTGEYRWPYRREELTLDWILHRFPLTPPPQPPETPGSARPG